MAHGRAVLIIAHPGHELLLHHWMEQAHPIVFALTDGSGGSGRPRIASSQRTIAAAGGHVGKIFGHHSDRYWYDCIIAGDPEPFFTIAGSIASSLDSQVDTIIVDAVEYFNPVHDLAAVVGHLIADRLAERQSRPALLTYPIEMKMGGQAAQEIVLDHDALARKLKAADEYREIAAEVERVRGEVHQSDLGTERLYRFDPGQIYPPTLPATPYYEIFAKQRISEGRYRDAITYRDHMLPLVSKLLRGS